MTVTFHKSPMTWAFWGFALLFLLFGPYNDRPGEGVEDETES